MHVADAHQRGDVGLVRLSGQRVSKKEDRVDVPFGNSPTDDQVAAVGAVSDTFDIEAKLLAQHLPRVASRDEFVLTEEVDVRANELQHLWFLLIVSDECDHGVRRPGLVSAERI